jgi:hypothetical protein
VSRSSVARLLSPMVMRHFRWRKRHGR